MTIILPTVLLAAVVGLLAVSGVWAEEAWLTPSIIAAACTQIFTPSQPGAKPYTIALGQIIGAASGFAGVLLFHAASVPALTGDHGLTFTRVGAVVTALLLTSVLQIALGAKSPAGGATAAVVALGTETADFAGGLRLFVGIVLVTVLGEICRRVLLRVTPEPE